MDVYTTCYNISEITVFDWTLSTSDYTNPPLLYYWSRAEQSSSLLPATSQHGHSWHLAPLGPMARYLFNVKTFVFFFSSFVVPPLIKKEGLDFSL
jgi:hypothetical protein